MRSSAIAVLFCLLGSAEAIQAAQVGFAYDEYIGGCCSGQNQLGSPLSNPTIADCKTYCDSESTCVSFEVYPQSHTTSNFNCWFSTTCTANEAPGLTCGHDLYIKGASTAETSPPTPTCAVPATYSTPGKDCGNPCLNGNTAYATLALAWDMCRAVAECGGIMDYYGYFYLRRDSDPDRSDGDVTKYYKYVCSTTVSTPAPTVAPTPDPTAFPTPYPTAFPTASPTPSPTPSPSQATSPSSATGDPHLQNMFGQRFDLVRPGAYVLVSVPRGTPVEDALLVVKADARRLGAHCSDMYFQEINATGTWANKARPGGFHFDAFNARRETPKWLKIELVELKVGSGHTDKGQPYLNVYVKNLQRTGYRVGGLLGEDDHTEVVAPEEGCQKTLSLEARVHRQAADLQGSVAIGY